ncbi:MAG: gfo/Idh/MocA family oxidoreductase, partial [Armatimonadota bacterium]
MSAVKIGIMSFAHIHAFSYADCLTRMEQVEFVGIADDDHERGRKAAKQFGIALFPNYHALLDAV